MKCEIVTIGGGTIGTFLPRIDNIITACGFSGHGIMHAPAVGRALCELALDGGYQTLDLADLGIERVWQGAYAESGIK